jgi:hypothetical protein
LLEGIALAGHMTVHIGPPSVGNGGNNPVSIPPVNPVDYEFIYYTKSDMEFSLAISPGILFGTRSRFSGMYVAYGGGLVLDANGTGPGIYSSIGYNSDEDFGFNAEFKQALGFDFESESVLAPYALRVGLTFGF